MHYFVWHALCDAQAESDSQYLPRLVRRKQKVGGGAGEDLAEGAAGLAWRHR